MNQTSRRPTDNTQNKNQSGNFDRILQLQGVGWLTRQAIRLSTITLTCKQYDDEQSMSHIDIETELSGGIKSTPEARVLDWKVRPHKDATFGDVEGRSRYIDSRKLEPEFGAEFGEYLGKGWDADEQVQSYVVNPGNQWIANQIWGFQDVDGERKYVRKVVVRKTSGSEPETEMTNLVYDYLGPLTEAS